MSDVRYDGGRYILQSIPKCVSYSKLDTFQRGNFGISPLLHMNISGPRRLWVVLAAPRLLWRSVHLLRDATSAMRKGNWLNAFPSDGTVSSYWDR